MDIASIITNKVIDNLNKDIVPWMCPYRRNGLPKNIDNRNYNGINIALLSLLNFPSDIFLTFDQVKKRKGLVKSGEKSTFVVGYIPKKYQVEINKDCEINVEEKSTFILRYFNVFNISQTTLYDSNVTLSSNLLYEDINKFIDYVSENICPVHIDSSEIPCYNKTNHIINMPSRDKFIQGDDEFYSTLFHEIIHSTHSLSNRKTSDYALEELIAEMGSSMICQKFGVLQKMDNSVSYIQHWLSYLKDNKKSIITAGSAAGKAYKILMEKFDLNNEV